MQHTEQEVRVLVVDDSEDAADGLTAALSSANYEARAAYNGQGAVITAREFQPHVVLLDLEMPRMDGFATAKKLRELESGGPPLLIAYSAHSDVASVAATGNAGFDLHVSKPCDVQHLLELLQRSLSVRLCGGQPLRLRRRSANA